MPSRNFTDPDGESWTVWDTMPSRPETSSRQFREGWLSFKRDRAGSAVCRLAPIPDGWEQASPDQLREYLKQAIAAVVKPPAGS